MIKLFNRDKYKDLENIILIFTEWYNNILDKYLDSNTKFNSIEEINKAILSSDFTVTMPDINISNETVRSFLMSQLSEYCISNYEHISDLIEVTPVANPVNENIKEKNNNSSNKMETIDIDYFYL